LERELERLRREQRISRSLTVAELAEVYLAQHDVEPVTIEKLHWLLGKAVAVFGDRPVSDLRSQEIAAWRISLPSGYRFDATQALRQALARAEKAYAEVKTMLGGTEPPAESAPAVALREAQEAVDAIAEGDAPYEQVFDLTPEQARAMLAMMSITDQRDFVRSVIAKVTLLADTRGLPPAERLTIELQPGIMAANAS